MVARDDKGEAPLLKLTDVHKTYHLGKTSVPALRGLNLEVHPREFTAVIGPSGSGKSTLLNLVGCIDDADSGQILLGGVDVLQLSDDQKSALRNEKIGFIFQSFNLIPVLDAYENIELPLLLQPKVTSAARKERVNRALDDVGLRDFWHHLPDQLSGGQRQRVAIARALVTEPLFVLADEPTANLDSETGNKIIDLMFDLNEKRGVTFLFSTHDAHLMSRVVRIVRIRDGVTIQ